MSSSPGGRQSIDWTEARARLDRAARAIAGDAARTEDEARRVLEHRARQLARPIATAAAADDLELVVFEISGETYAVESRYVHENLRLAHLTLVPGAEAPVAGLTAWRGELLTLLDLRIVTGAAAGALSDLAWVLVLGAETPAFGVLVDRFHGIARLARESLRPVPEGLSSSRDYLLGVTDEAVLVLDAPGLLRIYS